MKPSILLSSTFSGLMALGAGYTYADCPHREYGWSATVGGEGSDGALDIAVDDQGNVFTVGGFPGRVDFDPSKRKDRHKAKGDKGNYALFLTSYTPEGGYRWTAVMTGKRGYIIGRGIAISATRDLLITGNFHGKVDFNPGKGRDKIGSFDEFDDIFVTRLRLDGSYKWTRVLSGPGSDAGEAIDVDSDGNIFLTGCFSQTVDFDPGRGRDIRTANGYRDVFVTKLGPDGSYRWTHTFGGPQDDIGFAIAADLQGNVIVTGEFRDQVDFNPSGGGDIRVSNGERDFFITKLGPDGSYHWTHTVGGEKGDRAFGVTTDAGGHLYATGAFRDRVDFNPRGGGDVRTAVNFFDAFLTKLGPDGSYRWTRTFGGQAGAVGASIALDGEEGLVLSGSFSGTVDFDPTEGVDNHTSNGREDAFLVRMSTDGDYRFTDTFGGTEIDAAVSVTIDDDGNVLACGGFDSQDVDFDPTTGVDIRSSNGDRDFYITKHYCGQCEVLEGHHVQGKRGKIKATIQTTAPGGSVKIEYTGPGDPIIESFDIDDTGQAKFTLKKLKKGDYHCLITKIKEPDGHTLCQGPLAPRPVTVK